MTHLELLKQAHRDELTGKRFNRRDFIQWIFQKLEFTPDTMIEIGVLIATFSGWFMRKFPGICIYGIDPYGSDSTVSGLAAFRYYHIEADVAKKQAMAKFEAYGHGSTIIQKKAADAVNDVPDVDYVFIDGDHAYEAVKTDIELYLPKVKPGGVMMGHDFGTEKGVVRAVKECFGDQFLFGGFNKGNCWVHPVEP